MRVALIGRPAAPALAAAVERIAAVLGEWGVLTGQADADARLLVGADDPGLPARAEWPVAVLPACGPGAPAPWAHALVRAAGAVCLLDPAETLDLRDDLGGRTVLACGLPRPAPGGPVAGLDPGVDADAVLEVWRAEAGEPPQDGPAVTWVRGRGASALAAAAEAWAAGRAVVALPGTADHGLLRRGGALRAATTLEAVEATRLLLTTPPLAHALARRGRAALELLPAPERCAARAVEAAVAACVEPAGRAAPAPPVAGDGRMRPPK